MTAGQHVYLRQNVQFDPLVNQWYAWSYLLPPATRSMYIVNHHLKIMQSFVTAPQMHVTALKNPAMMGGPFMTYAPSRVGEVRALLDRTVKEQTDLLELAEAIKALDDLLQTKADGSSMEPLYGEVPQALKGYVELVYDLNNRPSFRLLDGLLYQSNYYREEAQSIGLSINDNDRRPFVFSTPKLEDDTWLHLRLPFRSEALDQLFRMKHTPQPYDRIHELLGIEPAGEEIFRHFFTDRPAFPAPPRFDGNGSGESVRIRYFGHACLLIESPTVTVLTDPLISYKPTGATPRYSYEDLPETIDYVVLTHNHQDH